MRNIIVLFSISLFALNFISAQEIKSSVSAVRIFESIVIDGVLDETIWSNLEELGDFIQFTPYNGVPCRQKTEAKICYTDEAIYISARMYDTSPDSMMTELGTRDSYDEPDTELFAVHINPYNDGINSVYFCVSISGAQSDFKLSSQGIDMRWDAVWESEISTTNEGWTAEIRIPFSALRILDTPNQTWGFNLFRRIPRCDEWSSWSYVSNELEQWWAHMGELRGVDNIESPVRLSFSPYISAYAEKNTMGEWGTSYNGGIDLKYGISESFTLDMTLIPDFGQIQSDDEELNLSPFEIKYNEKRQFFTEGTELFSKADIFYSRRIGAKPSGYNGVGNSLTADEEISDNPNETQLINATKFSGRTNGGLGIGILNGMTANTYATVRDSITGNEREVLTQPFTNYNMFVLDQTFANNSYISLVNSNVWRENYMANVTGTEFRFLDSTKTYLIEGSGAVSQIHNEGNATYGHKYSLRAGKVAGEFQYEYLLTVVDDKFNQNDLGYLARNNEIKQYVNLEYHKFQPFGIFLDLHNSLSIFYHRIYNPSVYADLRMSYELQARFKNYYKLSLGLGLGPVERRDYYETRRLGRYVLDNQFYNLNIQVDSDPRQPVTFMALAGFTNSFDYLTDLKRRWLGGTVTYKVNDQFNFGSDFYYRTDTDEPGYVNYDPETDIIYFGNRDRTTAINTLDANYLFNNKMSVNFRLRHYWSKADYKTYHELTDKGDLLPSTYSNNHDVNYNAFNIDMSFIWNFAPGSELRLVWKNAIYNSNQDIDSGYFTNFENTLDSPQINSLSVKILYYIDYLNL
ncbi:DUF5916 domain-containing protein [Bacteroidota bacterium]